MRKFLGLVEHIVDHHVAHVVNCRVRLALAFEMLDATGFGHEEPVADTVGHQAVDLFRHRHIAAAQAGFHMRHRDAQLLGDDRAGQC